MGILKDNRYSRKIKHINMRMFVKSQLWKNKDLLRKTESKMKIPVQKLTEVVSGRSQRDVYLSKSNKNTN